MTRSPSFAEVALPVPLRQTFTYLVPPELAAEVVPGRQVTVPFGRRTATGFVVALTDRTEVTGIKEILAVDGAGPLFTPELLRLTRWIADYYLASWGEVLRAALPGGAEPTEVRRRAAAVPAPGIVPDAPPRQLTAPQSEAVAAIDAAVAAHEARTFLLFGITGSGKTEVYLRTVEHALARGGQALVLVPEISLSPQMVRHCRERFGERVVVWHSALALGRRREAWRAVRDGRAKVVVGARSAVFAPFNDLRLVIVDEEHESAYKQDEAPRYHGRDVAIYRAAQVRAPVVLGSATPSLESFHHAMSGKYVLLELPRRIDDRPVPPVITVPLRRARETAPDAPRPRSHIFTDPLLDALTDRITRGEQAILYLNRRGHSTMVRCRECGDVASCPHCDIALTWHADGGQLRCHYCAHVARGFDVCPKCRGAQFVYRGVGTQKVEAELDRLLPGARRLRMDFDTTRRRGAFERILEEFRLHQADILLGTQMVARGLDFPAVTLVGVINADTQLYLPDFRSAERTFQLLTQVAGRAGRGRRPGEVFVQTFAEGHYAVEAASRHDYRGFFDTELELRRELDYPPLTRMINLLFDGGEEAAVQGRAEAVADTLRALPAPERAGVDILGPAPQSMSRLKGKYRWHLTLRGRDHRRLHALVGPLLEPAAGRKDRVRILADVDPASLI